MRGSINGQEQSAGQLSLTVASQGAYRLAQCVNSLKAMSDERQSRPTFVGVV